MSGRKGSSLRVVAGVLAVAALMAATIGGPASGLARSAWSQVRPRADARYLNNTRTIVSAPQTVATAATATATIDCPAGMQALGGGVDFDDETATVNIVTTGPIVAGGDLASAAQGRNPASTGWEATVFNLELADQVFVVGVICGR